jgi:hypothetical protein
LLHDDRNSAIVAADFRSVEDVLNAPEVGLLLDLEQPVGLLMVAVLHFVAPEDDPRDIVAGYRDAMPPGSLLALSHLTADHRPAEMAAVTEAMRHSRDPMYFRSYAQITAMFDGLELIPPGVVSAPLWRPEPGPFDPAGPDDVYVGMGRTVV